ncbi:MAG: hypothetical protein KBB70_01585 [Candidatus Pacebacteria bacterium]|jgi:hypothetical protein|nr:hypothetical protein [Candidatus Paceibacterota bacterium]
MKRAFLFLALVATVISAKAQITNTNLVLEDENAIRAKATISWSCSDTVEAFGAYDTSAFFTNAWPAVEPAVVFGPGTHSLTFTVDPLLPNFESFIRGTVRSYNDTITVIISVQTTTAARIGNLLGHAISQTLVETTIDFMDHGSDLTVVTIRTADSAVVDIQTGLRDYWIGTDTIQFAQIPDTILTYKKVGWNMSNPNDWTWSDTFAIRTPRYWAVAPYLDTMQVLFTSPDSAGYHIHGRTDSVSAVGYLQFSYDNWANYTTASVDFIPAGYFSLDVVGHHTATPGSTILARYVLQNSFPGTDTIWATATAPLPLEDLIPEAISIDWVNRNVVVLTSPLRIGSFGADGFLHAVRHDTLNPADTSGTTWSISRALTSADTSMQHTFHGAVGACYVMRTLVVENGNLRQSGYWQFTPAICFPGTTDIDEEADWHGAEHDLTADYFLKGKGADVIISTVLGQSEFKHFNSWKELYDYLPTGITFVRTLPHPRTAATWFNEFVKVE